MFVCCTDIFTKISLQTMLVLLGICALFKKNTTQWVTIKYINALLRLNG